MLLSADTEDVCVIAYETISVGLCNFVERPVTFAAR